MTDEELEDALMPRMRAHLPRKAMHELTRTVWRDGIDIERTTTGIMALARSIMALPASSQATISRLTAERDRTERNRDMWKGQCERQAEQLTKMRTALDNLIRCGNAVIGANIADPEAADAFEMYGDARRLARAALATPAVSDAPKPAPRPVRWPRKGDKITFLGKNGYDHELKAAMEVFVVGKEYEVLDCEVGGWSHSIAFVGVRGRWNGVMFELTAPLTDAES